MSAEVPSLTIAILDFNAARSGLPTYSELVEALRGLHVAAHQHTPAMSTEALLDLCPAFDASAAFLSRIPS